MLYLCEIWSGASAACQPLCLPKACSLCCWFWHFFFSKCFLLLSPLPAASTLPLLLLLLLGNWFLFSVTFYGQTLVFFFLSLHNMWKPRLSDRKEIPGSEKKSFFDEPVRIVIVILVQALSLSRLESSAPLKEHSWTSIDTIPDFVAIPSQMSISPSIIPKKTNTQREPPARLSINDSTASQTQTSHSHPQSTASNP